MAEVLAGLAVFGVVIALGWGLVRSGALPQGADGVLTRICFFAATPALLVTTISRADLSATLSATTGAMVGAELIAIISAWGLHRYLLGASNAQAIIAAIASGYVNAANLGIPVAVLILRDATPIAPLLLLQLLVITPATFTLLDALTCRGNPSRLVTLSVPLRNPLLWAVVAGVVLNLAGWELGGLAGAGGAAADGAGGGVAGAVRGVLAEVLRMLGATAVPLMMLALGMNLAEAPRPALKPRADASSNAGARALWWAVGWKLLVMPGLALGLGAALGLSGSELLVPVVIASLPTAQNVFLYASRYGIAKGLARDTILLTTVGFLPVVLVAAAVLG